MTNNTYKMRLIKNIYLNRFKWKRYINGKRYYNIPITSAPIMDNESNKQIGYMVYYQFSPFHVPTEIEYISSQQGWGICKINGEPIEYYMAI